MKTRMLARIVPFALAVGIATSLSTDARAARATKQEYAVIFPEYFYGQINEARHQPGAFALPARLALDLLEATCDEIGRNGFKRIVIINGHGGPQSDVDVRVAVQRP